MALATLSALRSDAVGDWEACGDQFYCRELLYDMEWQEPDLATKRVAAARYGGPIAMVRDERALVVLGVGSLRPVIRVSSAAGRELGSLVWEKAPILEWGWSDELELVIVEGTGQVTLLNMHCEKLRELSLGSAVERDGIARAVVFGSGVVALTPQLELWAINSLREPRPTRLAVPEALRGAPAGMAVAAPRPDLGRGLEVLLAVGHVVWQVDDSGAADHEVGAPNPSDITQLSLSPDGSFLAAFTTDGRLLVVSADFTKHLSEFDTKATSPPSSMAWCGLDAVALHWPELLLLVGPYGDYISRPLSGERLILVPELDGLRVVSDERHELLRKVPDALVQVFRPGSTAPVAQLWDARELFEAHNARSDKVLRLLQDQLPSAVATMIEASSLELSVPRQKALLRAACYGRAFCGAEFPPHLLHTTATRLRVLNALREPGIAMPLTVVQLNALTMPVVVARLLAYRHWLLAYRIAGGVQDAAGPRSASTATATLLATSTAAASLASATPATVPSLALGGAATAASGQEQVLLQWACAKISSRSSLSVPDQQLKEQLTAKLKACPTIRFAPLAAHAQAVGRRRLAIKLLEEETSCALQVPLLLSLSIGQMAGIGGSVADKTAAVRSAADDDSSSAEEEDTSGRALRKAIESGDTDLVYLVLFHIHRHRPLHELWALVNARALARNLFVKYCRTKEPALLETILTTIPAGPASSAELADLQLHRALRAWNAVFASSAAAPSPSPGSAAPIATAGGPAPSSSAVAADAALTKLVSALTDVGHKYALSREHVFQAKAVNEMASLRKEQGRLEKETGQRLFVGLSVVDTLRECIRLGHHKAALGIKKQFSVTDKRFMWLKLRTLAEAHDWEGLEAFAAEKRSGWEPFIEVAAKYNAPREYRARLIARLPDSSAKAEAFAGIEMMREAAEVAAKLKDADLFTKIQGLVSAGSPAGMTIMQIKERALASFK